MILMVVSLTYRELKSRIPKREGVQGDGEP